MLSRTDSSASARLRRARSSASVSGSQQGSSKPDYVDSEIARQHALAAASHAFQRASERGVVGVGGSNRLSRNNSIASIHLECGRTLSRQQSVKFAGRSAAERRQFIKSHDRIGVARTNSESVSAVHRHPLNSVSLQRQENATMTFFPYDGYCMPEDDIASTPSSYRRLRKAKSMVSPRKHAYTYGTPESEYNAGIGNTGSLAGSEDRPALGEVILRAPRSMSFLRGRRDYAPRSIQKSHDAAVQMARRQYLEQLENQRLKARQSFVLLSAARRQQKAFRKTVRTTSQTSYGSAISSSDQQMKPVKSGKLSSKARDLSFTIKETLKRVFHRSSENRDNVPIQQVDATRQHFRDYVSLDAGAREGSGDIPVPPGETVSGVSSRVPSVQVVPSDVQLRSRAASIRSVRSEGEHNGTLLCAASSNDSAMANSWATRQAAERNRLRENGGTQRSSSVSSNGTGSHRAFHRPMRTSDGVPSPVDSQRVYSALMKRLDKNRLGTKKEENHMQTHDYIGLTAGASAHGANPATTIRHIVEDGDDEENESRAGARISKSVIFRPLPERQADDVFSPANLTKTSYVSRPHASGGSREESDSGQPSLHYFQAAGGLGYESILTPQQAANHNEKVKPDREHILREARSTFFPSLGGPRITTPSPYKRVLGGVGFENERTATDLATSTYVLQKLRKISENNVPQRQGSVAGCSSVYSRTTSGGTPKPKDGTMCLGRREPSETGTAMIITDHVSRSGTGLVRKSTNPLSRPSNEWKAWKSSEIAALDRHNAERGGESGDLKIYMGHQREGAQIDGDDTQIGRGDGDFSPRASRVHPLSTFHGNVMVRQVPRYKIPSGGVFPLVDIGQPESVQSTLVSQQHGHGIRPVSSVSSLRSTRTYTTNSSMGRLNSASRRDRLRARSTVEMRSRYSPLRVRGFAVDGDVSKGGTVGDLKEAVDGQFGPVVGGGGDENSSPVGGEGYGNMEGTGLMDPLVLPVKIGVVGSQRMVDLFLSSRRRRIRGSDGSGKNAFL